MSRRSSTFYNDATLVFIICIIYSKSLLVCIRAFHLHQNVKLQKNGVPDRPGHGMKNVFFGHKSMRQMKLNNRTKPYENSILEDIPQSRRNVFKTSVKAIVPPAFLLGQKVPAAHSISPQTAASSYDKYASDYDSLDGGDIASTLGIDDARLKLLSVAKGDVLEIGVGTGLNIPKYPFTNEQQQITSITFVDVSNSMLEQAKVKAYSTIPKNVEVNFYNADATSELVDLFGDSAFDTVLDTFSLCVMGRNGAKDCLKQMGRVVKKKDQGGKILLLENSRSSNQLLGWYQDITAEAAATAGGKGCVYNQDVSSIIKECKFTIQEEEDYTMGLFRSFICTTNS